MGNAPARSVNPAAKLCFMTVLEKQSCHLVVMWALKLARPEGKQSKHRRRFTRRSKWQAGLKIAAIRQWKVVGV
jgi:hypothetical protein